MHDIAVPISSLKRPGLRADDDPVAAASQRDERRRRGRGARWSEDYRFRQILDSCPVCVGSFDVFGGVLAPSIHHLGHMSEIELAAYDPPSLGIDRVLTVRILDEQFAVCAIGKAPA